MVTVTWSYYGNSATPLDQLVFNEPWVPSQHDFKFNNNVWLYSPTSHAMFS